MINLSQPYTTQATVVTTGVPVQLAAQAIPPGVKVVIKATQSNAGTITVGSSSARALNTSGLCAKLLPGQVLVFQVQNTNSIWIDSTASGDVVEVISEV